MSKTNEDFIKEACELMLCNDILRGLLFVPSTEETQKILENVERKLKEINERPRAQKIGYWKESDIPNEKYVCSECGGASWYYDYQADVVKSRFCPNCGAKMVEPQERSGED